jgi:hypothetical protein
MMSKRWLFGTAAVFGLVLVLALSVPIVARWQLERQLGELFKVSTSVEAVSINPFTGHIILREVRVGTDIELTALDVTLDVGALFSRRVHIEQALVTGLRLPLAYTLNQLKIGELVIPLADDGADIAAVDGEVEAPLLRGWQLDDLLLQDMIVALGYLDNAHVLTVHRGSIAQVGSKFELPVRYDLDLDMDGHSLQALGEVSLATPLLLTLQLQLAADLADFKAYMPQPLAGRLALNQQISLQMSADNTAFSSTGSLQVDNLALAGAQSATISKVDWAGVAGFVEAAGSPPQISANGVLQLDNIALAGPQSLSIRQLGWSGSAEVVVAAAAPPQISTSGELRLDNIALAGQQPVSIRQLGWSGSAQVVIADAAPPTVDATGLLQASDIFVAPLGSLGQLNVRDLRFSEAGLALAEVLLTDLDVLLHILADKSIAGVPTVSSAASTTAESSTTAEPAAAEPMLQVQVDHIGLTGRLHIVDDSVQPKVNILLQELVLQADSLGQGRIATFNLQGRHQEENQTGILRVEGSGRLLDQPLNARLHVVLSQFELHQLSPYLGNGIRSGRLQLDADVKIVDSKIAADNRVKISGLKVDKGLVGGTAGGEMPISLALDLLKDGDGLIDLKIPLSSDLKDFSVDTSYIIQTALVNAARRAAFAYVKQALQPLGTLLFIKGMAEVAARPRFQPLAFAAASAKLEGDSLTYAGKIKDLLLGRPALTITLCGVATDIDKAALALRAAESAAGSPAEGGPALPPEDFRPALLALAEERGAVLTRQFVQGGVDVARLYACRATYVADESAPRLEISL